MLSPYNISSAYIVHIRDTEKDIILWSRSNATRAVPKAQQASREGVPSTAPAASSSGSTDVVMEPVPTQKRERPAVEEPEAEEDVEVIVPEPPQEAQRENIPTEEVMCPGCGANLVSGTIVCPACNTNITGTSEVKRGILAKRKELLNKLGYKYLDADTIERSGSQSKQFREESARGNRSPEGDYIGTARQQLKRAIGLGYTSMADRYENDVQFVERMTEHNITLLDIQLRDIVAHGHLPMPPRTRAQVDLGVGMRTANDLDFAKLKLMYVDEDIADITGSDPGLLERFEHSHWVIIWKRELYSLKEFQDLCNHRKTRGKGTNLLTFTCVMEIIEVPSLRELMKPLTAPYQLLNSLCKTSVSKANGRLKGMQPKVVERLAELMSLPRSAELIPLPQKLHQRPHQARGLPQQPNRKVKAHQALATMRLARLTFARCLRQNSHQVHRLPCSAHLHQRRHRSLHQHLPQHRSPCL